MIEGMPPAKPSVVEETVETSATWVSERKEGVLTIGVSKKGGEWILNPDTKEHIHGPFKKIETRDKVLVGKGQRGEHLLNPSTGESLVGPFAMDSIRALGDRHVVANGLHGGKLFLFDRATGAEVGTGHYVSIDIVDGKIIGKRIAKKDGRKTSEVLETV